MRSSALDELGRLVRFPDAAPAPSNDLVQLLSHASEARILVTGWDSAPINTADLRRFEKLELIVHTAGTLRQAFPQLDFPSRVNVCTAAHVNARPVAEYTLGLILGALRGAFQWTPILREAGLANWHDLRRAQAEGYPGQTVAIVGFGEIARQLIRLLQPFGFRLLVVSSIVRPEDEANLGIEQVTLQEAAEMADVLSLHEADLPRFHHMINAPILGCMKDGAVLINTARGGLIDEQALIEALRTRPLVALLDVLAQEDPPPEDHPLLHLPNCFITPHVAGSVGSEIKRFGDYLVREIGHHVEQSPFENSLSHSTIRGRA